LPHVRSQSSAAPQTGRERAWSEYLHWTQGASPDAYEDTERLAWERLQLALIGAGPTATPLTALVFAPLADRDT
jgi:hypothetical protein